MLNFGIYVPEILNENQSGIRDSIEKSENSIGKILEFYVSKDSVLEILDISNKQSLKYGSFISCLILG